MAAPVVAHEGPGHRRPGACDEQRGARAAARRPRRPAAAGAGGGAGGGWGPGGRALALVGREGGVRGGGGVVAAELRERVDVRALVGGVGDDGHHSRVHRVPRVRGREGGEAVGGGDQRVRAGGQTGVDGGHRELHVP